MNINSNRNYSITECVNNLTELTEQNLELLDSINKCFYTKSSSITTQIGDNKYTIPSFLYLESKINELESNFKNLVNAPVTGQAAFSFDGSTQGIIMQGFQNAPNDIDVTSQLNLENLRIFNTENRDILKDFTNPFIFTKLQLSNIPTHINEVYVKKIIIKNSELKDLIGFTEDPTNKDYPDVYANLFNYKEDIDYIEYDTRYKLPIKVPTKYGEWSISEIISSSIDTYNLIEYINLETTEDLIYKNTEDNRSEYLSIGDILITYDDKCKFEVVGVDISNRILKLKVLQGYANLMTVSETSNLELSYLKFFDNQLHDEDSRTLKIPLEEDRYICLFISPINSQLNVRSNWGTGVCLDVHQMRFKENSKEAQLFDSFYNENINNIGDIIYDLAKFTNTTLSNIDQETFKYISSYKPSINPSKFIVSQTNKHIFDNVNLENITSLNKQKSENNNRLIIIQNELTEINNILTTTDFSNLPIATRTTYENRQVELNSEKNSLTNDLINLSNQITYISNNTYIPITSAKYSVIGYIDVDSIETQIKSKINNTAANIEIIKINVLYRYKGTTSTTTDTVVIDDLFTYSTWKEMKSVNREKRAYFDTSTQTIKYKLQDVTNNTNQFNSINIPINYGEVVDMKVQLQYSLGYPYVTTTSDWSDVIELEFPETLIVSKDISDILSQNIKDTNVLDFKNILLDEGITSHVQDSTMDQDKIFYHKPDSISSGFYTSDTRRTISLKDKLYEMNNSINDVLSSITNNLQQQLTVTIDDSISNITIRSNETEQTFTTPNIVSLLNSNLNNYTINIILTNTGTVPVNIYSMYYGEKNNDININNSKWSAHIKDYWSENIESNNIIYQSSDSNFVNQKLNQFIYFRVKKPFTNTEILYNKASSDYYDVYPYVADISLLQIESAEVGSVKIINPGDGLIIPVNIRFNKTEVDSEDIWTKDYPYISFSLWLSQFSEPVNYTFKVKVPYNESIAPVSTNTQIYTAVINK